MTAAITPARATDPFVAKVERLSGQNLLACIQCGRCSAGCPLAEHMDILPSQIIRFAQLGLRDDLLGCRSIWICVSCLTCNSRCPKGVGIAEVFEALRQILLRDRHDHLVIKDLSVEDRGAVPPIALISSMRKHTS